MKRENVLREAISYCRMKATENFIPCDHCPMMKEGCDEPVVEYVQLPDFLVDEIQVILAERAAEPMTKQRWLS